MGKNTTQIRDIKGYMMEVLFNAGRMLRAVRKENEWGFERK